MRRRLDWDALFVVEHDDLRRARDGEHFQMARQLGRTLITMDRDYLDDRLFPMVMSPGVIVLAAPGERALMRLLRRVHEEIFDVGPDEMTTGLPLECRKLHIQVDWKGLNA
jgi:predicted nuclease of predicted toxin-antitoxin system